MLFKSQASRSIFLSLFIIVLLPYVVDAVSSQRDEYGLRLDMPASGQIRIENQYGEIAVEVWQEKYLSLAAKIAGGGSPTGRSPVSIDNRKQLLVVSIVRTPLNPPAAVSLNVKIPETAHTDVITGKDAISIRGLPASASLRSTSGTIRVNLPNPLNADITARTTAGVIRSELGSALGADGRLLQTRIGAGERVLRINTDSGQITLASTAQTGGSANNEGKPPELIGPETNAKGAGTPESNSDSQEVSEGDVIRVDSQLVTLNTNVIDRNTNRGLTGLGPSDFQLYEDGVEQRIVQFDSASAPFDLMLLIDLSGSTREVVKLIRSAALHFIEAARPSDRIGIITFAGQARVISPLTLDREILRERVAAIDTAAGDTKLYDATEYAINELVRDPKNSRRTAIVLMSDGLDGTVPGVHGQMGSKLTYPELLRHINEFDGVIYTLWLNTYYQALNPNDTQPEAFDMGHDRMREVADAGGGIFYEVERLDDLAGAYERVVADLGTVYSLAYRPINKSRDGKWRAIRVSVSRPAAVARGKRGYYAK